MGPGRVDRAPERLAFSQACDGGRLGPTAAGGEARAPDVDRVRRQAEPSSPKTSRRSPKGRRRLKAWLDGQPFQSATVAAYLA